MKIFFVALAIFLLYAAHTSWFSNTQSAAAVEGAALLRAPASGPAAAAARDLSNRLSIPASDIALVSQTPRTWTDTCLGVPQPREGCAGMRIEGFELVLQAAGAHYVYRTDGTGAGLRRAG